MSSHYSSDSSDSPARKASRKTEQNSLGQQPKSMPIAITQRQISTPPIYYRLAINILKPLYRLQVWRRSHQRENYSQEVAQRFGKQYPPRPMTGSNTLNNQHKVIWCHAVSLGETNTVAPLLDALLQNGYQIWLTNTTQTGFARGASRFADDIAQGRMSHSYVPVDSPAVIKTFLAQVQPVAALFVETELWANILVTLSQHNIPSILVNGRLSAASFKRYQKIGTVSASMMQNLTLIIAQDDESAERFEQLGALASQIRVTGSLKWVINSPSIDNSANQNAISNDKKDTSETVSNVNLAVDLKYLNRPVWVAASTHKGEERAAIALHKQLLSNPALADSLLIIVPRHPERFDDVATLIQQSELQMARRSIGDVISTQSQVYLADTMGELMQWYALADVALVGGSLVDVGGHNPVEPASVATPILMGQYTESCQSVVDNLASVGALYQPNNKFYHAIATNDNPLIDYNQATKDQPLVTATSPESTDDMVLIYLQLQSWLNNTQQAKRAGQAGEQLTAQQQSVLTQQLAIIEGVIEQFASSDA